MKRISQNVQSKKKKNPVLSVIVYVNAQSLLPKVTT